MVDEMMVDEMVDEMVDCETDILMRLYHYLSSYRYNSLDLSSIIGSTPIQISIYDLNPNLLQHAKKG